MAGFSIPAFLQLTRFWNLLIIGLAQYFTAIFLINKNAWQDINLFLLASSTILIAAAGYIINDYHDTKIDYINKPEKVVVGKKILRRVAMLAHLVLSMAGILLGFYLSGLVGVLNIFAVAFLWLYSINFKRQPFIGNFVVALLTGFSIVIVEIYYHTGSYLVVIYGIFAGAITLIREIIKDMEDLQGDNTFGCKTLPIIWGIRRTKALIYTLMFLFAFIVIMFNHLFVGVNWLYFFFFLYLPSAWLLYKLHKADTKSQFHHLSQLCKVIMLMGIISMMVI
jgi:4-hydroxybenzoate polyprenyltransferase